MAATAPLRRCDAHQAEAGWGCTVCERLLCPDCAAEKFVPPVTLVTCGLCGELAEVLHRPRAEVSGSFTQRVPLAFAFPFRIEGLPLWLGLTLCHFVFSYLGGLGALVSFALILSMLFSLVRATSREGDALETTQFVDFFTSVAAPLIRYQVLLAPVWAGVILAWQGFPRAGLAVASLSLLWVPTTFIGAAMNARLVDLLNPMRVLNATRLIGADYFVYLGALLGATLLFVGVLVLGVAIDSINVPFVGQLLKSALLLYPLIAAARLAGYVALFHPDSFGAGEEQSSQQPALGDTKPRGAPFERAEETVKRSYAPIEFDDAPTAEEVALRAAKAELARAAPVRRESLDAAALPSVVEHVTAQLRGAITRGDAATALEVFHAQGASCVDAMTAEELSWVGESAAAQHDYDSALLALEHAAKRETPPEALGRTWVLLARLLSEKLGRRDEGRAWMERVVTQLPGTKAAASPCEAGRGLGRGASEVLPETPGEHLRDTFGVIDVYPVARVEEVDRHVAVAGHLHRLRAREIFGAIHLRARADDEVKACAFSALRRCLQHRPAVELKIVIQQRLDARQRQPQYEAFVALHQVHAQPGRQHLRFTVRLDLAHEVVTLRPRASERLEHGQHAHRRFTPARVEPRAGR